MPGPVLWWTVENLLVAGALAALVWVACRAGRVGPVGRHALWLLVLVKLLTPPLFTWPWALDTPWPGDAGAAAVTHEVSSKPSLAATGAHSLLAPDVAESIRHDDDVILLSPDGV